jgi:hypothetical protein
VRHDELNERPFPTAAAEMQEAWSQLGMTLILISFINVVVIKAFGFHVLFRP